MCWILVLILLFSLAGASSYINELKDKNFELEKKLAVIEAVEMKRGEQWNGPMN